MNEVSFIGFGSLSQKAQTVLLVAVAERLSPLYQQLCEQVPNSNFHRYRLLADTLWSYLLGEATVDRIKVLDTDLTLSEPLTDIEKNDTSIGGFTARDALSAAVASCASPMDGLRDALTRLHFCRFLSAPMLGAIKDANQWGANEIGFIRRQSESLSTVVIDWVDVQKRWKQEVEEWLQANGRLVAQAGQRVSQSENFPF